MIEKIAGLGGLKRLKILSLSRNYIKSLVGLVWFILRKEKRYDYCKISSLRIF